MKNLNLIAGLLLILISFSCSSEEDDGNQAQNNGFNINGNFYPTQYAYISDENTIDNTISDISIILANVDPFQTNQSTGINYVFFDFPAVNIEPGTITNFPDYQILENANLNNFQVSGGNTILDDNQSGFMTTAGSVTINSITATTLNFTFTFTREDGEVITGNYSGNYVDTSN